MRNQAEAISANPDLDVAEAYMEGRRRWSHDGPDTQLKRCCPKQTYAFLLPTLVDFKGQ